ncbi:HAD family hydrolase [Streptomyces sp. NPDC048516]|uniref:HAD family hydrolase n=1 Tax=Streptomyces sp. NPDC048516 TaxID=3365565 RepID=UPI003712FDFD
MRWLIFDYGNVISRQSEVVPELASLLDVEPESFARGYWRFRDAYDRGWSDLHYWRAVGHAAGRRVTVRQVAQLTRVDLAGWRETAPEVLTLLGELNQAGVPLALLSNAPRSHGQFFRRQPWSALFRHLVFSGEVGVAKPERDVWEVLLRRLRCAPGDCLFFDDRRVNIDSARTAGVPARHWTGPAAARQDIAEAGFP